MTKWVPFTVWVCLVAGVTAQSTPNFSGTWAMNPSKGQNLGMMTSMQLSEIVTQTPTDLRMKEMSSFQGQDRTRELRYDLTGVPTINEGPMGDKSETLAKWSGDKLITTWTSEGAVAGTKVVRTETRSLSADGKTMTVESVRGMNPPVVMVFDKR